MRPRTAAAGVFVLAALFLAARPADAGCGCDKPPPHLAAIRPAFASPGDEVTLFPPKLRKDTTYTVHFQPARSSGSSGSAVKMSVTATSRRDFGDGIEKYQLVVQAPELPPGPTKVFVSHNNRTLLKVSEDDFTMLQPPLVLGEVDGVTVARCYRAAVDENGTVYFPLDISAIAERMAFDSVGRTFPLLFGAEDIAIYNTQGVLMQLLGPAEAGIFAVTDPGAPDSFELLYDRHEFRTYRAKHMHEGGYGLDPTDPAWHVDGTRHIDHDHLVIAIQGTVEGGGAPQAGMTPPFDLEITTVLVDAETPVSRTTIQWSKECGDDD